MVDRIWSIIPWAYVWIYVLRDGITTRSLFVLALPTIWGIRLTFNYARKGGYNKGEEDYRWVTVRKMYGPIVF
jgi:steroid 5-alpha reductase family enzyme